MKLAVAVALFGTSLVGAKSFQITLSSQTQAGAADLHPGQYNVSIDGTKVKFTDVNTGKSVATDATTQNGDKKFASTAVDSEMVNGKNKIQEIDLGGTATIVKFQ